MNTPKPAAPQALPPGHPLQLQLVRWIELRDHLQELSAKVEYLRLVMRLEQRRS